MNAFRTFFFSKTCIKCYKIPLLDKLYFHAHLVQNIFKFLLTHIKEHVFAKHLGVFQLLILV
jgi:hypothetical protein